MLFPISHEKMTVRRLPVVTVALIVLTFALHALAAFTAASTEERAVTAVVKAHTLYLQKPSLGVCDPLKPFLSGMHAPDKAFMSLGLGENGDKAGIDERYDAACKELGEAVASIPSQRFGYVPARANVLGLFTYIFVHADWWHVIGNMWFLFLCGLALEDRWGRLPFLGYYLIAGVVAAGVHHLLLSSSTAGLIGASGAVAGAMGAFVVLFATTRIRFVGFLAFRLLWFTAPAYVMLPLWAAIELLYGLLSSSSGTAHWAHVGGFAFGAAVAGVFRVIGVDKRLDNAVERAIDPRIDTARALVTRGEAEQAVLLLEGLLQEKPDSPHVKEALEEARRAAPPKIERGFRASIPGAKATSTPRTSVPSLSSMPSAPRASAKAAAASDEPEGAPYFPAPPPKS
jgi:membrane associated rhomboid family serine protease